MPAPLLLLRIAFALAVAPLVFGQAPLPDWSVLGQASGIGAGTARCAAAFDDGVGARLYVGGSFSDTQSGAAANVARFDGYGSGWSALGAGVDGTVFALHAHGGALIAGGAFAHAGGLAAPGVARWDGHAWSALGTGLSGTVYALTSFDDGSGAALYAGGSFTLPSTGLPTHLARWDGAQWSAVGGGCDGEVRALAVHDDGTGAALYAAGEFTHAGTLAAERIARWDGASWSALSTGVNATVHCLLSFDDGSGPALYLGGQFWDAGGVYAPSLARWSNGAFSYMGYFDLPVRALHVFDAGSGPSLYAGGDFTNVNGLSVTRITRWSGTAWQILPMLRTSVYALTTMPGPSWTNQLVAIGPSTPFANGVQGFQGVARFDGTWKPLGGSTAPEGLPVAFGVYDEGVGPRLFVGTIPGGSTSSGYEPFVLARFANDHFEDLPLPSTVYGVRALLRYHDVGAAREELFVGTLGSDSVLAWDGTNMRTIGSGFTRGPLDPETRCADLCAFDDGTGTALYAGGSFVIPGVPGAAGIARWNGSAWEAVAAGLPAQLSIDALEVFDSGGGARLFAGGIQQQGSTYSLWIGAWDGLQWTEIVPGLAVSSGGGPRSIDDMLVFDDGTGSALYVAGGFDTAGGQTVHGLARWNGTQWSNVGVGLPSSTWEAYALLAFDEGTGGGRELFVAAVHHTSGPPTLFAWNGASWRAVDRASAQYRPFALAAFDDAHGNTSLFLGGSFDSVAGRTPSSSITAHNFAAFATSAPIGSFCSGDGQDVHVSTACPCSNFGSAGHGCAWSNNPSGARLTASGERNPDTLLLTADGLSAAASGTVFWKANQLEPQGIEWGDGLRCIGGSLIRLGTKTNAAGVARYPEAGNAPISIRGQTPPGSGLVGYYQTTFRNAASYCTPNTFNSTNGVRVVW